MASTKFDTTEIDREIAALRAQRDVLDTQSRSVVAVPGGGPAIDWDADTAIMRIDKQLRVLSQQRIKILCGEQAGARVAVAVGALPNKEPSQLRIANVRVTKRAKREPLAIDEPLSRVLSEELHGLIKKHSECALDDAEDEFEDAVQRFKKFDRHVPFTRSAYVAFIGLIATLGAQQRALAEFQRNRRRELEDRIRALEDRPHLRYVGVWKRGQAYSKENLVTHHGSMWYAADDTVMEPGKGGSNWTLCVKRGRDMTAGMISVAR